jgi:hypothetical protein
MYGGTTGPCGTSYCPEKEGKHVEISAELEI